MALDLIRYPNPMLLKKSEDCKEEELAWIKSQVPEMTEIMLKHKGVGLSAIQVGIPKRFCILIDKENPGQVDLIINPVILELDKELQKDTEGCLSLPLFWEQIERPIEATVEFRDESWTLRKGVFYGIMGRCIQHEIDHMDGILQESKVSVMKRQMWLKKAKKKGFL